MNLNSVIIPNSETFPEIVMNKEVSVVIVIFKTFKLEKRSQYKSLSDHVRFFAGKSEDRGKI